MGICLYLSSVNTHECSDWSYGTCRLSNLRNHQTVFQSHCTVLHPPLQHARVLFAQYLHQDLTEWDFFKHSNSYRGVAIVILILILLKCNDIAFLLLCLFSICMSFLDIVSVLKFCSLCNFLLLFLRVESSFYRLNVRRVLWDRWLANIFSLCLARFFFMFLQCFPKSWSSWFSWSPIFDLCYYFLDFTLRVVSRKSLL